MKIRTKAMLLVIVGLLAVGSLGCGKPSADEVAITAMPLETTSTILPPKPCEDSEAAINRLLRRYMIETYGEDDPLFFWETTRLSEYIATDTAFACAFVGDIVRIKPPQLGEQNYKPEETTQMFGIVCDNGTNAMVVSAGLGSTLESMADRCLTFL